MSITQKEFQLALCLDPPKPLQIQDKAGGEILHKFFTNTLKIHSPQIPLITHHNPLKSALWSRTGTDWRKREGGPLNGGGKGIGWATRQRWATGGRSWASSGQMRWGAWVPNVLCDHNLNVSSSLWPFWHYTTLNRIFSVSLCLVLLSSCLARRWFFIFWRFM